MLLEVGVIAGKERRDKRMLRRKNKTARHKKDCAWSSSLGCPEVPGDTQARFLKRATKVNENNQNENLKEKRAII